MLVREFQILIVLALVRDSAGRKVRQDQSNARCYCRSIGADLSDFVKEVRDIVHRSLNMSGRRMHTRKDSRQCFCGLIGSIIAFDPADPS